MDIVSRTPASRVRSAIEQFKALPYHGDAHGKAQLRALRQWQGNRLRHTHSELLHHPEYRQATYYFIDELYSSDDFDQLAIDVERIVSKVEKILPNPMVSTLAVAMELNTLSTMLDEELARLVFAHDSTISSAVYVEAFAAQDRMDERMRQLSLLTELSHSMDKYVRSRLLASAFKMARKPANRAGLATLYDFIDRGLQVLRPLGSASEVVTQICIREQNILQLFVGREFESIRAQFPSDTKLPPAVVLDPT